MSGTQARRWMLTINNPTFKESEVLETLGNSDYIKYMCWCAENADEENHTPHYHVYVSLLPSVSSTSDSLKVGLLIVNIHLLA